MGCSYRLSECLKLRDFCRRRARSRHRGNSQNEQREMCDVRRVVKAQRQILQGGTELQGKWRVAACLPITWCTPLCTCLRQEARPYRVAEFTSRRVVCARPCIMHQLHDCGLRAFPSPATERYTTIPMLVVRRKKRQSREFKVVSLSWHC